MSRMHSMSVGLARYNGPHYCLGCGADWPCDGSRREDADAARAGRETVSRDMYDKAVEEVGRLSMTLVERDSEVARLREALIGALAQWVMYSDEGRGDEGTFGYIEESTDPKDIEAAKYRNCVAALWPNLPQQEGLPPDMLPSSLGGPQRTGSDWIGTKAGKGPAPQGWGRAARPLPKEDEGEHG